MRATETTTFISDLMPVSQSIATQLISTSQGSNPSIKTTPHINMRRNQWRMGRWKKWRVGMMGAVFMLSGVGHTQGRWLTAGNSRLLWVRKCLGRWLPDRWVLVSNRCNSLILKTITAFVLMGRQCLLMGMITIIKVKLSLDNDQTQRPVISKKNLENSKKSSSLWSLAAIYNKTT